MKVWGDLKMNWDVLECDEVKDWLIYGIVFLSWLKIMFDFFDSLFFIFFCIYCCIYF